jgi:hypothetical protein
VADLGSLLSNKGKTQLCVVCELPTGTTGLLQHLYPLTQGVRKFSSKPVLLEMLEAKLTGSQSTTDEKCSHRIVLRECLPWLVPSEKPGLGHPHVIRRCREMKFRAVPEPRVILGWGRKECPGLSQTQGSPSSPLVPFFPASSVA